MFPTIRWRQALRLFLTKFGLAQSDPVRRASNSVSWSSMPSPADGLIVEFVGLPGAGKTTISHALVNRFRRGGVPVTEPTFDLSQKPGRIGFRQLRFAMRLFAGHPILTLRWMDLVVASRQKSARDFIITSLNLLYSCALVRQSGRRPGVHIFDQGLLQAILSVQYSSRQPPDHASLAAAVDESIGVNARNVAVFVQASPEIVMTRLQQRCGRLSRLERLDSTEEFTHALSRYVAAVAHLEQLAAILEDRLGHRFTIITLSNKSDNSVDSAAEELFGRLVEIVCTTR